MSVIELDARRPLPCPHCDELFAVRRLEQHLRFDCEALRARRAHPSNRTPDGAA